MIIRKSAGRRRRLQRRYRTAGAVFLAFVLFTCLAVTVDVSTVPAKEIVGGSWAPSASEQVRVGFSGINVFLSDRIGYSGTWYSISGVLGILCLAVSVGCALLFPWQWFKRRSLRRVDHDVKAMVFLLVLFTVFYLVFKLLRVTLRPVIVDPEKWPESSYPSIHTLMGGMLAWGAGAFLQKKLPGREWKRASGIGCALLGGAAVLTRLLSGVHWLTDIVAGLLLSASVLLLFTTLLDAK